MVAETWLDNPNYLPQVNHKDGNKLNNSVENLEWITLEDNVKHAYSTGLINPLNSFFCKIRNYYTGEIKEFNTVMEAARYMGFDGPVSKASLSPRLFGKLIKDTWEIRWDGDSREWFYKNRKTKVLSRYMVTVETPDGLIEEFFSNASIIKRYRLYGLAAKSMRDIALHLIRAYPEYKITYRDAYNLKPNKITTRTRINENKSVFIADDDKVIIFESIRKAAEFLGVDKSIVKRAIDNLTLISGYIVMQNDLELIDIYRLRG